MSLVLVIVFVFSIILPRLYSSNDLPTFSNSSYKISNYLSLTNTPITLFEPSIQILLHLTHTFYKLDTYLLLINIITNFYPHIFFVYYTTHKQLLTESNLKLFLIVFNTIYKCDSKLLLLHQNTNIYLHNYLKYYTNHHQLLLTVCNLMLFLILFISLHKCDTNLLLLLKITNIFLYIYLTCYINQHHLLTERNFRQFLKIFNYKYKLVPFLNYLGLTITHPLYLIHQISKYKNSIALMN